MSIVYILFKIQNLFFFYNFHHRSVLYNYKNILVCLARLTTTHTCPYREARQILKDKGFDKNEKIP